jgi:hypothetical protein
MDTALARASAACLMFAVTTSTLAGQKDAKLTESTLAEWRAAILPSAEELAWRKIPWRSELHTALVDGHVADKPILLWAMNGHPLGCV